MIKLFAHIVFYLKSYINMIRDILKCGNEFVQLIICSLNIGIKHVFPCINIRWVPREVLKTEGYNCIKVSKKSILELYFDVLFWHYFVLIFLHRRTTIISIYILVPGQSVNNYSIMAEN